MKTITLQEAVIETIKNGRKDRDSRPDSGWLSGVEQSVRVRPVPTLSGNPNFFIVWEFIGDSWGVFSLSDQQFVVPMIKGATIGFGDNGDDKSNPKYLTISYGERRKDRHYKTDLFSLSEKRSMGFEAMSPTYSWEGFWSVCVGDKWGMFSIKDDKLVVPIEYKDVSMAPHEKDWKKRRLVLVTNTDDRTGLYSLDNQSVVRWWD